MSGKGENASIEKNLSELKPDDHNANKHTPRGRELLQSAVSKYGSREAGTIDKNGKIIGGNLRQEIYGEIGFDKVQIVKADPNIPVYLQYDDLDLDDPDNPASMIALGLNRIVQVSIEFDSEVLTGLQEFSSVDLGELWFESELEDIIPSDGIGDEELNENEEIIKPRKFLHVLISVPVSNAIEIKDAIDSISDVDEIEILYGSN